MSRASMLSVSIGPYLLKGWTLTDSACPNAGCGAPRLRKPNSTLLLCPACDTDQLSGSTAIASTSQDADAAQSSSTSGATLSSRSRASTPATDASRAHSPDLRFVETPEMIARREQSDRASAEIGRRLLQGWAMLGDECPNPTCYGVPLMRPPPTSSSSGKNPRMECVVCERVYIAPKDAAGLAIPAAPEELPKSEDAGHSPAPVPPQPPQQEAAAAPDTAPPPAAVPCSALSETTNSLETALQRMSSQFAAMTERTPLDTRAIGETADAISKTIDALSRVRQLQAKPSP
ncbi:hypothetical protein AURDEDRAFT_141792 [Auricularia subglabra TFB-10046 SS5]|nr:hypothetical protein AURDEDRAFT_141792 [Auricularia subglabra TFB-10046 SS5]